MDTNPNKHNFLILAEVPILCNGEEIASSTNGAGTPRNPYAAE